MYLKIALVAILSCLTTYCSFAQNSKIIRAGLSLSNVNLQFNQEKVDNMEFTPGFELTALQSIPLKNNLGIELGLSYRTKGTEENYSFENSSGESFDVNRTVRFMYITVPVRARYDYALSETKRIYSSLGLYAAYGLSAKEINSIEGEERETYLINLGTNPEEDDLLPYDFGLSVSAGILLGNIDIGVNWEYGAQNILIEPENGDFARNNNFGITLGYKFGEKLE